jgi:hypothetical protein
MWLTPVVIPAASVYLDLYFYEHNSPSVGWRIQRWHTKHVLSGALLVILMMLVTHFVFNPIGM